MPPLVRCGVFFLSLPPPAADFCCVFRPFSRGGNLGLPSTRIVYLSSYDIRKYEFSVYMGAQTNSGVVAYIFLIPASRYAWGEYRHLSLQERLSSLPAYSYVRTVAPGCHGPRYNESLTIENSSLLQR